MRVEQRGSTLWPRTPVNQRWEEPVSEAKSYVIPKQLVWKSYQRVKANRGAAGVDGESLAAFEKDLKGNLYKVWNRMSSGSYFPPPVRLVGIPKDNGGKRPLGIPTVADRVAQTVVKMVFEPLEEPVFHEDSYGYRTGRSALEAVGVARKRCWGTDWVIDLDIKAFFDSIPHDLIERPWPTTLTFRGSGCTLRGGFVSLCSGQTGSWGSGRRARRKAESSVRCWPTCCCTTRSAFGCKGPFRASSSSGMRTMPSSIAVANGRREQYWRPFGVGSSSAVWSFIL